MPLQDAAQAEAAHREHLLDGVAVHVLQHRVAGELLADLPQLRAGALVESQGHFQLLERGPQGLVVGIVPVPAVHLVRPQEHAAETELPDTAACLRHRVVDVERGDHPGAEQALGVLLAELVQPVVVRARHGRGESRLHVGNGQGEEAPRGIDHRDVDALDVHRLDLNLRGPAPLLERPPALLVLRMVMPVAAPAAIGVRGDAPPRLAVPGQAQVPGVLGEPLRGAIPERGIDVPLPEIGRLDDVDVAVEHLEVSVRHGPPPQKGFASATGLPELGNDVLGEQLDLAHLFLPRHEALIEEPAEPLEIAAAADAA